MSYRIEITSEGKKHSGSINGMDIGSSRRVLVELVPGRPARVLVQWGEPIGADQQPGEMDVTGMAAESREWLIAQDPKSVDMAADALRALARSLVREEMGRMG